MASLKDNERPSGQRYVNVFNATIKNKALAVAEFQFGVREVLLPFLLLQHVWIMLQYKFHTSHSNDYQL
jgi:tellurite resistance protein TehA-like permease